MTDQPQPSEAAQIREIPADVWAKFQSDYADALYKIQQHAAQAVEQRDREWCLQFGYDVLARPGSLHAQVEASAREAVEQARVEERERLSRVEAVYDSAVRELVRFEDERDALRAENERAEFQIEALLKQEVELLAENERLRGALDQVDRFIRMQTIWMGTTREKFMDMPAFRVKKIAGITRAALTPKEPSDG
jgi:chromosome segregation ATPase